MRMLAALAALSAMSPVNGFASSIVMLDSLADERRPSIVTLGAAAPSQAGSMVTMSSATGISPSIEALPGETDGPAPSFMAFGQPGGSATGKTAPGEARAVSLTPMVIRGGIVDGGIARPTASTASAPTQDAGATTPALDPNDRGTARKRKALKRQQQQQRTISAAPEAAPAPAPVTE